ncbi:MAG: DNA polymerase III subunit epsilon [Rubrivivax sp.]|nr:DNA polymerase III subunit epsilon [Rubrivivax sp.]
MAETPQPRRAGSPRTAAAVAVLCAVVLAWAGAFAGLLWVDLAPAERETLAATLRGRGGLALLLALMLPLLLWAVVRPWVATWPRAAQRLREQVAVVTTANAGHRVQVAGPRELRELAQAIDALAQAHAAAQRDVESRVQASRAALAAETRRLATLMSELTIGVVVCNRDGHVLLYNARARALLGAGAPTGGDDVGRDGVAGMAAEASIAPLLGLGRPIGALLGTGAVEHAWQQVQRRLAARENAAPGDAAAAPAIARFAVARRSGGGDMLHVQMVPTLDEQGAAGGYLLLLDDITHSVRSQRRRDALLLRLTEGTRAALGNLRAAAQALHQYPQMEATRRTRFTAVVHDEAERLAAQLGEALQEPGGGAPTAWPLEEVRAGDIAFALQRRLQAAAGPACRFDGQGAERACLVDSHAIVQLLAWAACRLRAEIGVAEVRFEVDSAPAAARDTPLGAPRKPPEAPATRLQLVWLGRPLPPGCLAAWERVRGEDGAEDSPQGTAAAQEPSLREVLDRHGAEWWAQSGPEDWQRLCVQLAPAEGAPAARRPAAAEPARVRSRPATYDFDLFHQAGQNAALDETPLAALACTVFDTETTGLRPSEGDEIIALGAVRIVNGRLLEDECFDRRVRPRRAVRASAEAVHGISTASLAGEPPLEQVLPAFARFCEGTVLVAHNAAFDMRFLELARVRTGVAFDQPVLDTMLLSAAVLPGHRDDEHHLEQIAARLGVAITGRHEALGDALTAARVLLRLVPLLAERGIVTLGQAREASQRVAEAHVSY